MRTKATLAAAFLISLFLAGPAFAATSTFGDYTWRTLRIGAGGFITGIDVASDGTKVMRTDTYGGYLWSDALGEWQQLVNINSMPTADVGVDRGEGVYELKIAPSNTNRFYMIYRGYVYRTDNKGANWIKTAFPRNQTAHANDGNRVYGPKMAIDPINPDVVYVTIGQSGVWATSDAGATWQQITTVPASLIEGNEYPGNLGIAIDKSSGSLNGKSKTIYLPSWGNGVWKSTDAGTTWTQISGGALAGPKKVIDVAMGSDGIYYAVDLNASSDRVWKYQDGAWTNMTGSGNQTSDIAVDPNNPKRIFVTSDGGTFNHTEDSGLTWSGYMWGITSSPQRLIATDIPWLGWTLELYKSMGSLIFDPVAPGKVWIAEGIGVWNVTISPTQQWFDGPQWYSQSKGIEQLVANQIISPPGGPVLVASWDRPHFVVDNPEVYPSVHGPDRDTSIIMGWGYDWSATNPSFIAGVINWWGSDKSGYSTDGGRTWTTFPSKPPAVPVAGSIAVSSPDNMVWVPSNNGQAYYTKDRGATWKQVQIAGVPTTGESGWGWAYYFHRFVVAADRVNTGTFYLYNYGPSSNPSAAGVYRSTDGGDTWTKVFSDNGAFGYFTGYSAKLKSVPGKAGHLFFAAGHQGGGENDVNPGPGTLLRSTDGGATWTSFDRVREVWDFGFGKSATAGGYPAIYIVGWVDNVWGIYRSDNEGQTWTKIGEYPLGSIDGITSISGDMNTYGEVYVGFGGSGWAYGMINGTNPNPLPPPPPPPPPTPAATLVMSISPSSIQSGQSATLTWTSSNATSCTSAQASLSGTSGSVTLTPTVTTTYTITCTGSGGSGSQSVTLTVTAVTPSPPPTSPKFTVGDRVKTTDRLNVRSTACNSGKPGKQNRGAIGTVVTGSTAGCGYTWVKVNFDAGSDGWVVQDYLVKQTTASGDGQEQLAAVASAISDALTKLQELFAQLQGIAGQQ